VWSALGIFFIIGFEYTPYTPNWHWISWLTLPILVVLSLALFRKVKRAASVVFAMAFFHEGVWYSSALYIAHSPSELIHWLLMRPWIDILVNFYLAPIGFFLVYVFYYHRRLDRALLLGLGIFAFYMVLWLVSGFPIAGMPNSYWFETGSWLCIFAVFSGWEVDSWRMKRLV
jgi:hypothetical protein